MGQTTLATLRVTKAKNQPVAWRVTFDQAAGGLRPPKAYPDRTRDPNSPNPYLSQTLNSTAYAISKGLSKALNQKFGHTNVSKGPSRTLNPNPSRTLDPNPSRTLNSNPSRTLNPNPSRTLDPNPSRIVTGACPD